MPDNLAIARNLTDKIENIIRAETNKFKSQIVEDLTNRGMLMPEGARFYVKGHSHDMFVIEQKPQYRTVQFADLDARLPFPYVVFVIQVPVGTHNEGYKFSVNYRTQPLRSLKDKLILPNLPNVRDEQGRICLGNWWADSYKFDFDSAETTATRAEKIIGHFWASLFDSYNYVLDSGIKNVNEWARMTPLDMVARKWPKLRGASIFTVQDLLPPDEFLSDMIDQRLDASFDNFRVKIARAIKLAARAPSEKQKPKRPAARPKSRGR